MCVCIAILDNIEMGDDGDFLQGCAVADFGQGTQVVLSWHKSKRAELHTLLVPDDPSWQQWKFQVLAPVTLKHTEGRSRSHLDRLVQPQALAVREHGKAEVTARRRNMRKQFAKYR